MAEPTHSKQIALSDIILASAALVRDVQKGGSLSDLMPGVPAQSRPAVQSVTFHVMRRLGLARALKTALVPRKPPEPLLDALLQVALALLETATRHGEEGGEQRHEMDHEQDAAQSPRGEPVYAVHTVVDQAVNAAAGHRRLRNFKGMVNAVLRNFLRGREALLAEARQQPEACWNHPEWWVNTIRKAYPGQWRQVLSASDHPGPMTLRVNIRRKTVAALQAALAEAGIASSPLGAQGLVLETPRPVQAIPGFEEGWWSVQDASAQQAALLLAPEPGMRVLDACAAPGGKTAHLLELADIHLQALDADPVRLERIRQTLARLGLDGDHVKLAAADAADVGAWWDGEPFDLVLADVPCTASGIVRRHPDIRWLRRESDLRKTAELQRRIADALWQTVKPGGKLLYATCSVFPQEGEQQARAFAQRWPDATRLEAPGQILPLPEEGRQAGAYDGFFYALFAKNA
ncbi:16S rRNA (cytosine(967)-C(5))-methyltransferase RsmB [Paracandidimonas soli]|uniref:16S rRNA (cytosine(967)-C(5))-methyltransferase RsmB n=1 Tax=Paracandidimonas soli TaxID=1917182 RepID=UPI003341EE26